MVRRVSSAVNMYSIGIPSILTLLAYSCVKEKPEVPLGQKNNKETEDEVRLKYLDMICVKCLETIFTGV